MADDLKSQAELNYDRYVKKYRREAERDHTGEVALMVDGEIKDYFPSLTEAYNVGVERHGLGNFSIQEIGAEPVQLGAQTLMTL